MDQKKASNREQNIKREQRTVADSIRANFDDLTQAERRFATTLLENYPVSCMGTITKVAEAGDVSTPTVVRMLKKVGFDGFSDFQSQVQSEVEAKISQPIIDNNRWSESASDEHILNTFADKTLENLKQSLIQIDPSMFDAVVDILADSTRPVHIVGGRVSHTLAEYLFTHLQVARPNVIWMTGSSGAWPNYLLDMAPGGVMVAFDFRRYESPLIRLLEMARDKGVHVVLLTDQWGSPASKFARYVFNLRIEVPSCWDSAVVPLFVLESLITAIQDKTWDETRERINDLEASFDIGGQFRKFNP